MEITLEQKKEAEKQVSELQRKIDYDVRDFTIGHIVNQFNKGRFYVPNYQRFFVWNVNTQSRFIESILLGIPIPFLFLATDNESGNLEVVDGAQRIQTLNAFILNRLTLINLTKLPTLNGFKFEDLTSSMKRKFEDKALRMIVLEELTTLESRKEIFNRINTAGVKANPTEVRMGTYDGPFIEFIKILATNELYLKLVPQSQTNIARKENFELLFRFFAYSDRLSEYSDSEKVEDFVNRYAADNQNDFDKDRLTREFYNMLEFADKNFPIGFKKAARSNSVPKARFEALSVGINLALKEIPNLNVNNIDWIDTDDFKEATTSDAANNKSNLLKRINFVKNKLMESNIS